MVRSVSDGVTPDVALPEVLGVSVGGEVVVVRLLRVRHPVLPAQHLLPAAPPGVVLVALRLHPLKLLPHVGHEVPGLVEILGADGVVLDELDVVVLGDVALAVVPDAVHHSDTEVLNGSQQIFISDEISPDSATVGHLDVLREIIQEHRVSEFVPALISEHN